MTNELKQKDTRQKESTERREKKGYSVRKNNRVNQNKKEIQILEQEIIGQLTKKLCNLISKNLI